MAFSTLLRLVAQNLRATVALLSLALLSGLFGCGGGGGSDNSNPTPPVQGNNTVTGIVADLNRNPIVGALVTLNGQTATTSRAGDFTITGLNTGVYTIQASATLRGARWVGQNTVVVATGTTTTPNVNILLSDINAQGAISGKVSDNLGNPLVGAKVYAAGVEAGTTTDFATQGSTYAVTQANGTYTIPSLPFSQYTVTAVQAGYLNQTKTVTITSTTGATATFTLSKPTGTSTVPAVTDLSALSFTSPTATASRAISQTSTSGAVAAIRAYILQQHGLLGHHAADPTRVTLRSPSVATRSTPTGSIIENDLFWPYDSALNNVLGYDILRSVGTDTQFGSVALARDPLATFFADASSALTPDTTYFYSLARLDTINFPTNGTEGPPVNPPVQVEPLNAISQVGPSDSATVSGTLTFSWTAVSRAFQYHVLLYNQLPDLQSGTNADPTQVINPIWAAPNANSADPSVVNAPTTSLTYNGAALAAGTYYWVILAYDQSGADNTFSAVRSFVIPAH